MQTSLREGRLQLFSGYGHEILRKIQAFCIAEQEPGFLGRKTKSPSQHITIEFDAG
jgi:hypothetical protein